MSNSSKPAIAYLAPEIPGLSSTFVYEELLGLERRGFLVTPVSVRRPALPALHQKALTGRVSYLYAGSHVGLIIAGLASLPGFSRKARLALSYLLSDVLECGPHRMASWKLVYQFLAAIKLARILKRNRCIHLHAHFADTATQIAMYASALSGVPFTVMAHANDIFQRGLLLGRKAERSVRMVTISEYNRRYLENIGTLKDRLAVVRCGVTFPAMSRPVPMADRRPFRIGTLGRMVEKKGFDTLIKAVAHLKKSGHSVTLCIAGDGPLKGILHRLVHDLDLAAVTRFEGSLPHPQVAHWMLQFDAFVLACKMDRNGDMDGIPVVLMEAMSQSIPVVSTRISGIPELVVHERTGLLAEPDNHVDLARQIERLLMHRELGATMTASALEHVMQEFGQEKNIDRLIECFNLQE